MGELIQVKHRDVKHRGGKFAGPATGDLYLVHPDTGFLHLIKGARFAKEAGVDPADAKEFATLPRIFDVAKRASAEPAPAPAPAPLQQHPKIPPPPAPRIEVTEDDGEIDGGEIDGIVPEAPAPAGVELPDAPAPNATKAAWVKWAAAHNVELDTLEIEQYTKKQLIAAIEQRYTP